MKNGTSLPSFAPMRSSAPSPIPLSYSVRNARSTAAASLLPPPKPACMGIRFSSVTVTPSLFNPVSAKNTFAALMHRLSFSSSVTGASQRSLSRPVPRCTVTVSHRLMRCITDVTSW